jgi:predicted nucleotidyltransferase
MRITEREKDAIVNAVKRADPTAQVWLFGSRTDDSKKGGDIDIAILSEKINNAAQKTLVRRFICDKIGEQKLDIVTTGSGKEAIFRLAVAEGIRLQ